MNDLEYKTAAIEATAQPTTGDQIGLLAAVVDDQGTVQAKASHSFYDLSKDPEGTVWAIVAVTGVKDDVDDIIVPGAFTRTLAERKMRGVKGHDWNRAVAVQRHAIELMPGDPRLPATLADGSPWPADAGALAVKAAYILATTDGREAWEEAKAFDADQAYSIGYKVTKAKHRGGVRYIYDLDVYEFSPVLHGAHRMATQQNVKSGKPEGYEAAAAWLELPEGKARSLVRRVQDSAYWGRPVGTVIVPGMKPVGPRARAGARDRGGEQRAGQGGMGRAGLGGLRRDTAAALRARQASARNSEGSYDWNRMRDLSEIAMGETAGDLTEYDSAELARTAAQIRRESRGREDRLAAAERVESIVRERARADEGIDVGDDEPVSEARARQGSTGDAATARANLTALLADDARTRDMDWRKAENLRTFAQSDRPLVASEDGTVAAMHRGVTDDKKKEDLGWAVVNTRTGEILAARESDDDVHEFVESAAERIGDDERRQRDGQTGGDGRAALQDAPAAGVRGDTGGQAGGVLRRTGGAGEPDDRGSGGRAGRAGSAGGDVSGSAGQADRGTRVGGGAGDPGDGDAGSGDGERGGTQRAGGGAELRPGAAADDGSGAGARRGSPGLLDRTGGDGQSADGADAVADPAADAGLAADGVEESDLPAVDLQAAGQLARVKGENFQPAGPDDLAPAGVKAKLTANLEALRTLRSLQRPRMERVPGTRMGDPGSEMVATPSATPEQQAVLARWAGWGGLPKVFDESDPTYATERTELRGLMSDAEWNEARRNTLNAHYTDARVTSAVWDLMGKLGFSGGRVLEPGSGSGNFIGFAPEGADMVGVELDSTTAGISKFLYPNAKIRNESFAKTRIPDGSFDAAVGNVPFGRFALHDAIDNPAGHSIHNHFIIKSLKKTRPGGVVAVLTSRYTMDSLDSKAREEMAQYGDLVGAVRLPTGSHRRASGTDVIEDILVFRRRGDGEDPADTSAWVESGKTDASKFSGNDGDFVSLNPYWKLNPGFVLGDVEITSGQYGPEVAVRGDVDMAELPAVLDRLADSARVRGLTMTERGPDDDLPELIDPDTSRHEGHIQVENDGTFTQARGGAALSIEVPATQVKEMTALLGIRDTLQALLRAESTSGEDTDEIATLRRQLNERYDAYVKAYGPVNRYTTTANGGRKPPPVSYTFRKDPQSAIVRALETYDPTTPGQGKWGAATKASIFTKRAAAPRQLATTADNPADALTLSMDTYGEVNLTAIAEMLGVDEPTARAQLGDLVHEVPALSFTEEEAAVAFERQRAAGGDAFDEPDELANLGQVVRGTRGDLIPKAEYLSGNVRRKLAVARAAARHDDRFSANVAALEAVIPADLGRDEIDARLGAAWIPASDIQAFANELLQIPEHRMRDRGIQVRSAGNIWTVEGKNEGTLATETWGTDARPFPKLLKTILEQRSIKVTYTVEGPDGSKKSVVDQDATFAAQAKAEEIQERFAEWIWEDPARSRRLAANYNEQFNALALRDYSGSTRTFPGMAAHFKPRAHQVAAVERIVNEPTALLGHVVGAGKTAEMVLGTAELKRLGLARKPAIVVPNHMLEQFTREYLEIYPNAKVLAAGSDDLSVKKDKDGNIISDGRREFVARAAVGDWDAVILTQEAFGSIPMSVEQRQAYVDREMAEMRAAFAEAKEAAAAGDKADEKTVKEMEKAIISAEAALEKLLDTGKKDEGGLTFEETGIDYLMIDEAHHYSNLRTLSRIPNAGATGSGKATDLHMKMEYLRATTESGRVATFATGTPIRNTVTQSYIMQRFLRPDLMQEAGINSFDSWAATFGQVVEETELKPEGTGGSGSPFRQTSRFAKFRNVPELLRMFHVFADIKLAEDLKLPTPNLTGGRAETVVVPGSDELRGYIQWLGDRAEDVRGGKVDPEEDNMLSVSMDGRKAALSMALVREEHDRTSAVERASAPAMQHQPGKLEAAADRINSIWERTKDRVYPVDPDDPSQGDDPNPGGMQIVFLDLGTPKTAADIRKAEEDGSVYFDAYDHLRTELVARGMDAKRIRFMHEAKNDAEKAQLFAQARNGQIDVLIGSTEKMGVGTNVQRRAVALHHLDAPWRPADVEQRDGRIMRQGNLNPDVEIIRYVTEGSFDAYMWQTLERKARFINQIMKGSLDVREIEDVGDTSMSYAEIKAMATGNLDLLSKAKVDALRQKLERLNRTHNRNQTNLRADIGSYTIEAEQSDTFAEQIEAAIETRTDTRGDKFAMTIGGVTHRSRAEAADALREVLEPLFRELRYSYGDHKSRQVATVGGHTVVAQYVETSTGPSLSLGFDGIPGEFVRANFAELITNKGQGPIVRAENFLASLEGRAAYLRDHAENRRDEVEKMSTRVGLQFSKLRELEAARGKSDRLQRKMQLDSLRKERYGNNWREEADKLPAPVADENGNTPLDLRFDPAVDTDVNDDPILGRDDNDVPPVDIPAAAVAADVEREPAQESPREVTSPPGEVDDSGDASVATAGLTAGTMDAARADADAALVDGDADQLDAALGRMGVPSEDGRAELARALIALPDETQRRRLDQIEVVNTDESEQADILERQRQRELTRPAAEVEPEPAAGGEQVPEFPSIAALSRHIADAGEGTPGDISAELRGVVRGDRADLTDGQRRMINAAVAGQGRGRASAANFNLDQARAALQRLADGDATLPANALGQHIEFSEPDPDDTTLRIRNGRPEPMRTRTHTGRVVQIERLYNSHRIRLVIERDGGPNENGIDRAVYDVPADDVLTMVDPDAAPTVEIPADQLEAAREIITPADQAPAAPADLPGMTAGRRAQIVQAIEDYAAQYGGINSPTPGVDNAARYVFEGHVPDGTQDEWDWIAGYIAAHPQLLDRPAYTEAELTARRAERREVADRASSDGAAAYRGGDLDEALRQLDIASATDPSRESRWQQIRERIQRERDAATPADTTPEVGETAAPVASGPIIPDDSAFQRGTMRALGIRPGDRIALRSRLTNTRFTGTVTGTPTYAQLRLDHNGEEIAIGGAATVIDAVKLDEQGRPIEHSNDRDAGKEPTPENSRARTNRINAAAQRAGGDGGMSRRVMKGSVHHVSVPDDPEAVQRVVDALYGLGWAGMVVNPTASYQRDNYDGTTQQRRSIQIRVPDTGPDGKPLREFTAAPEAASPDGGILDGAGQPTRPIPLGGPNGPEGNIRPRPAGVPAGAQEIRPGAQLTDTPAPEAPAGSIYDGVATETLRNLQADAERRARSLQAQADRGDITPDDQRQLDALTTNAQGYRDEIERRRQAVPAPEPTPEPTPAPQLPDVTPAAGNVPELPDPMPGASTQERDAEIERLQRDLRAARRVAATTDIDNQARRRELRERLDGIQAHRGAVTPGQGGLFDEPAAQPGRTEPGIVDADFADEYRLEDRLQKAARRVDEEELSAAFLRLGVPPAEIEDRVNHAIDVDPYSIGQIIADAQRRAADEDDSNDVSVGDFLVGNPEPFQMADSLNEQRPAHAAELADEVPLSNAGEVADALARADTDGRHADTVERLRRRGAMYEALSRPEPDDQPEPIDDPQQAVRDAYTDLAGGGGGYVDLADVRERLTAQGMDRTRQDDALREMFGTPGVDIVANPYPDRRTDRDREAAITIDGEPRHLLVAEDVDQEIDPFTGRPVEPATGPEPTTPESTPEPEAPAGPEPLRDSRGRIREPYMDKPGAVRVPLAEDQRYLGEMRFEDMLEGNQAADDVNGAYMSGDGTALLVHDRAQALGEVDNALDIIDDNLHPPGGGRIEPEDRRRWTTEQRKWRQIRRRIESAMPEPAAQSAAPTPDTTPEAPAAGDLVPGDREGTYRSGDGRFEIEPGRDEGTFLIADLRSPRRQGGTERYGVIARGDLDAVRDLIERRRAGTDPDSVAVRHGLQLDATPVPGMRSFTVQVADPRTRGRNRAPERRATLAAASDDGRFYTIPVASELQREIPADVIDEYLTQATADPIALPPERFDAERRIRLLDQITAGAAPAAEPEPTPDVTPEPDVAPAPESEQTPAPEPSGPAPTPAAEPTPAPAAEPSPEPEPAAPDTGDASAANDDTTIVLPLDGPMRDVLGGAQLQGASVVGRSVEVTDPAAFRAQLDDLEGSADTRKGRRAAVRLRGLLDDEIEPDEQTTPESTPDAPAAPEADVPQDELLFGDSTGTGGSDETPSMADQDVASPDLAPATPVGEPGPDMPADIPAGVGAEQPSMADQDVAGAQVPPGTEPPVGPDGAPLPDPAQAAREQAELSADMLEQARQVEADALGLVEADDGELEVTQDVAERQTRVEKVLRQAASGKLDVSRQRDSELTEGRRDLVDELRLQEALRRRDLEKRRERAQRRQAQMAAFAAQQPQPGADTGEGADVDTGVPAPAPEAVPAPEPTPPAPQRRPGLAGAVEDLADAYEENDPERIAAALQRARTSLARSRGDSEHHAALATELARVDAGVLPDPERLRAIAESLREAARQQRNSRARARTLAKRLERERLRSLLGQYDAELRNRGRNPDDYGGRAPVPGPSDEEIAAADAEDAGPGATPGATAEGGPGAEPGAGQGIDQGLPPSFDRADPDGPAGQARTTELADGLLMQPWRMFGTPESLLGTDEAAAQRRREAARAAMTPVIDQFGPMVRRRTNEELEAATRQARAQQRRMRNGARADASALTFAALIPRAQRAAFVEAMRGAAVVYKRHIGRRGGSRAGAGQRSEGD